MTTLAAAQEAEGPGAPAPDSEAQLLDGALRRRIALGLDWLAAQQPPRGLWLAHKPGHRVAISSLAGLAFLSAGEGGRRGPHKEVLLRLTRALCENQLRSPPELNGLFWDRSVEVAGTRPLHGHGLALLFLGQAYGQLNSAALEERVRLAIERGVALTLRCQNDAGGWFYYPGDDKDEGSVTVTQIQGLRACRNAGFAVPKEAIDRAVQYVVDCQDFSGGIRYRKGQGKATPALTAAGVTVLYNAGRTGGTELARAVEYLDTFLETELDETQDYYFYTQLYASQAYHQRSPSAFRGYFRAIRSELARLQRLDGSWPLATFGDEYATAVALIILQMPEQYLPITER